MPRSASVLFVLGLLLAASVRVVNAAPQAEPTDEARAVVQKVLAAYRGLESYRDQLSMSYDLKLAEGAVDTNGLLEMMLAGTKQEMTFVYGGDKRVLIEGPAMSVASDGTTVTVSAPELKQYRQVTLDGRSIGESLSGDMIAMMALQHPLYGVVTGETASRGGGGLDMMLEMARTTREETVDGRSMIVLECLMPSPDGSGGETGMDIAVDAETNLVSTLSMDMTETLKMALADFAKTGQGEVPDIEHVHMTMAFADVQADQPIPAETFQLAAGDMEKVDAFKFDQFGGGGAAAQGSPTQPKAGDEAPVFTAPTLAGGELTLSDLRGKVVVLDFWATWCRPCVQAIPLVQKVSLEYADKNVVFLGINQDRPGAEANVKKFVEDKGITFGHVMDPRGKIGLLFGVQGIPTTVVIDAKGVVRTFEVGFHGPDALRHAVDAALAAAGDS